jgi:hypothetical protein
LKYYRLFLTGVIWGDVMVFSKCTLRLQRASN